VSENEDVECDDYVPSDDENKDDEESNYSDSSFEVNKKQKKGK